MAKSEVDKEDKSSETVEDDEIPNLKINKKGKWTVKEATEKVKEYTDQAT